MVEGHWGGPLHLGVGRLGANGWGVEWGFPQAGDLEPQSRAKPTSLIVGGGVSWVEMCEVPAKALF